MAAAIREQEGLAPYPMLVIISASADLDPVIATPAEGVGGAVMIITTAGKSADDLEPLRAAGITVLEADGTALDLGHIVDQLAGTGFQRLLCEGGPRLHNDLLAAGMLDEVCLTLAPVVVGGRPAFYQRCCPPGAGLIPAASRLVRRRWGAVHQLPSPQNRVGEAPPTSEGDRRTEPTHDAIYNQDQSRRCRHACGISCIDSSLMDGRYFNGRTQSRLPIHAEEYQHLI